jgi:phospholipid/cholesterol/gamma-HCH transport system permease protein
MTVKSAREGITNYAERIGRQTAAGVEEIGNGGFLLLESFYWLLVGPRMKQPVRFRAVVIQMMEIGVNAIPLIGMMAGTIGAMMAMQSIYMLRVFGAESQVTYGVAFSVVREFAPLITGILVAGRSGSALAARLGTLKVMGINPVRVLVVPALLAMLVMVPALTIFNMMVGMLCAGLYINAELGISLAAYSEQVIDILSVGDVMHGVGKSVLFAILIALIGVINGASVTGGAEGVGKVTTRAVVQAISAIIVTDMFFAFMATR